MVPNRSSLRLLRFCGCIVKNIRLVLTLRLAGWPNGKALDYESRDCRFDPCVGQPTILPLPLPVALSLSKFGCRGRCASGWLGCCLLSGERGCVFGHQISGRSFRGGFSFLGGRNVEWHRRGKERTHRSCGSHGCNHNNGRCTLCPDTCMCILTDDAGVISIYTAEPGM